MDVRKAQELVGQAAGVLKAVLDDPNASSEAKVEAASKILDMAIRGLEATDLLPRIEALERKLKAQRGQEK